MSHNQTCTFCQNPEAYISIETCCSGCSKLPKELREYWRAATCVIPESKENEQKDA